MSQEDLPNLENETAPTKEVASDLNPNPQNTELDKPAEVEAEAKVEVAVEAKAEAEVKVEAETEKHVEAEAQPTAEVEAEIEEIAEEEEEAPEVNTEPIAEVEKTDDADASEELDDEITEGEEDSDDTEIDINLDLESLNKDELIALAIESTQKLTTRDAFNRLKQIRPIFNDLLRSEKKVALQKHIEDGNEAEAFEYNDDAHRERFKEIFIIGKNARLEERKRIEEEKIKNFKKKEELLEQLRTITESDETEKSLQDVKALQQEWRAIRVLPADKVQGLWDSYHFLLDKFYDNHSINIELKELDRKKNLEIKIELTKKVDELSSENSLKKSFILLNKYQEEFRNTGPVPREFNKEIWERFRQACDKVYEQKKAVFEALEGDRIKNLELKQVLVEKASLIAQTTPKKVKDWKEKAAGLDGLMNEWKKIGQVPRAKNDEVWKAFRKSFNTFYDNKSAFFKQINNERKANLIIKEDICKRAEEVKTSEDLLFATNELKKLQREWKDVGPVPDKVSNAIWKRFRAACDEFFERKQKAFEGKKDEEVKNLEGKEALITKLESLLETGKAENILNELKAIQQEWNRAGFVPIKKKKDIDNRYRKASDQVFNKFKLDRQSLKQGQIKDHYANLSQLPSGNQKLKDEAFKIKKKMSFLSSEIATLENNMEFFGRSKGAQKLKDEIAGKIEKTKDQLNRLKAELKLIKSVNEKPADSNAKEA
jgi:hypothetical protein